MPALATEHVTSKSALETLVSVYTLRSTTSLCRQIGSKKEMIENILRCKRFHTGSSATSTSLLPLLIGIFISHLIISASFPRITQTSHSSIDFFESIVSLRMCILIRMHFKSFLFKSFFQISFSTVFLNAHYFVKVFAFENSITNFAIFSSILTA